MTAHEWAIADRLRRIRLLVTDVDGVLTDGTVAYDGGDSSSKAFHVRDGLGIRLLLEHGITVAVVSGRNDAAVEQRVRELEITHYYPGSTDKVTVLRTLLEQTGIEVAEVAALGDDLVDAELLRQAGVGIAVQDAHRSAKDSADWITTQKGGRGALREVADAILSCQQQARDTQHAIVIPSRYAATRLPGKPLRLVAGRPLIEHVWQRACETNIDTIVVATDDHRVRQTAEGFGAQVVMTNADHTSGTDRIAEVANKRDWPDDKIVINLQGDEPCMPPTLINTVAHALGQHLRAGVATLATPIHAKDDVFDPNIVKVVLNDHDMASYFSRAPIPWSRSAFGATPEPDTLPQNGQFLRHLGLYAYRVGALRRIASAPPSPCEKIECLEQLRALAIGENIHVTVVDKAPSPGVDTERDLLRAEKELAARGS